MRHRRGIALLTFLPLALAAALVFQLVSGDLTGTDDDLAWAQVSSCGNAILEPGEDCDPPGSITCPPGSPAGAFEACLPGCLCPAATTTTTSSTTTTTLAGPLDHFQCYEVKPAFFQNRTATVTDQFGTLTETVRAPNRLCPPANKNGRGITDPTDHLTGYKVRASGFLRQRNHVVVDQFGTLVLDLTRPDVLLVPTSKDGVQQQPPLDHFQCYKVRRSKGAPKFVQRTASIVDQLSSVTVTLKSPYRLCAPANKNGSDPSAPQHPDHLLCYKTRSVTFPDSTHTISNQFGTTVAARVIARRELCVPALKDPAPTTTTTSTTTSTTATTSTTSTTTVTTMGSTTITTSTSTSTSTTTTLYGSPSRAFIAPVESLLD